MAINADVVRNWQFPEKRQAYSARDTILYGLSLGYGSDPENEADLRFVYEENLLALPTMAVVLCHPGFWISDPATGIDATKAVHGEQLCTFHRPLPATGSLVGRAKVTRDRQGGAAGALVITERVIADAESGLPIATLEQRTCVAAMAASKSRPRQPLLPVPRQHEPPPRKRTRPRT
jgi:hypothetical protein